MPFISLPTDSYAPHPRDPHLCKSAVSQSSRKLIITKNETNRKR